MNREQEAPKDSLINDFVPDPINTLSFNGKPVISDNDTCRFFFKEYEGSEIWLSIQKDKDYNYQWLNDTKPVNRIRPHKQGLHLAHPTRDKELSKDLTSKLSIPEDTIKDYLEELGLFLNEHEHELFQDDNKLTIVEKMYQEFKPKYKLSDYGHDKIGDIITFEAIVKRIPNNTEPLPIKYKFECYCGNFETVEVDWFNDTITQPKCSKCSHLENGNSNLLRDVREKEYTDIKVIEVEETPDDYVTSDTQPRSLKCLLKGELSRNNPAIHPGDKVHVAGQLKVKSTISGRKKKEFYVLDVINLINVEKTLHIVELTSDEIQELEKLNQNHDMFDLLSQAILPDFIHPNYITDTCKYINKAILCQLLSQTQDGMKRGQIHILLVGDPGLNKSQILLRVRELFPKSSYAVGGAITTGGLIGIANRDEFNGQWVAEPGLITKTHKGILCIDEIDKIDRESLSKLNEALEQQTATLTKANLNVSYPAQTTVLCAMNPVLKSGKESSTYSHFDRYEDLNKQVNLPESFMDRFDLIIMIQDMINPDIDRELVELLTTANNKKDQPVGDDQIIKYVMYARQKIPNPEITEEARGLLSEYYKELRDIRDQDRLRHPNPRVIESLKRISQSIARCYLSEEVTAIHMNKAIELYKICEKTHILHDRTKVEAEIVGDISHKAGRFEPV